VRPDIRCWYESPYRYRRVSLIVSTLERRFPAANGYRTLFPSTTQGGKANTGLIRTFSKFYADNTLFPLAASLIPWDKLPAPFIEDRSKASCSKILQSRIIAAHSACGLQLFGATIDPKAMANRIPGAHSTMSSHLVKYIFRLFLSSYSNYTPTQLLVEQQLSDGRVWLFETETPSLADISVQFIIAWARAFDRENVVFDPKQNPYTLQVRWQ